MDRVKVDDKAVGQLADRDGHAARAEVIAALDEAGDSFVAEETLDFAFLGGVALLDLGGHRDEGLAVVALRGAGGAADAVAAGAPAEQDHDVAGDGALADHIFRGDRADHGADLKVLGDVAGMIDFTDLTGRKADLVAVGGVSGGCGAGELPLGELAGNGLGDRHAGVAAAGDAHGLADVGAAGEGIADAAADAGGRAAEGLDLRGVVVGFVLEHQEPVLLFPADRGIDVDRAGVDLLALVEIAEQAALFEDLRADRRKIHQRLGPGRGFFLAVDLDAGVEIPLIGGLNFGIVQPDMVDVRGEGRMAAVVGPVGVDHADFGDCGVAVLLTAEVGLQEFEIVEVHRKAELLKERSKAGPVEGREARDGFHRGGNRVLLPERLRLFKRGLAGLHGVDDVAPDGVQLLLREIAGEKVDFCGANGGTGALRHQLDALACGVGALVKLTGQGLDGENRAALRRECFKNIVHLGLRKYGADSAAERRFIKALRVIAVDDAKTGQGAEAEQGAELVQKAGGLLPKARLFFNVNTAYHSQSSIAASARRPMSRRMNAPSKWMVSAAA